MQVLFARHHVRVFRFRAAAVVTSDAEDLISEVFLDVWRQAGKFEGGRRCRLGFLSIARFKALSVLRRKPESGTGTKRRGSDRDTSIPRTLRWRRSRRQTSSGNASVAFQRAPGDCDLVYYTEVVEEVAEIVGSRKRQ